MFSYNKVILGGVACNTPTLRQNGGGTNVTNFTLKTVETWKDRNTGQIKKYSKYHKIVAWGKTAERAVRVVRKDAIIMVEGKLNYHSQNQDGNGKRNVAEIKAYVIDRKGKLKPSRPSVSDEESKSSFPDKRDIITEENATIA